MNWLRRLLGVPSSNSKKERAADKRAMKALNTAAGTARDRVDRIVREYEEAERRRVRAEGP